jgi:polyhydroxyalkanoate synthesis regulator phasin
MEVETFTETEVPTHLKAKVKITKSDLHNILIADCAENIRKRKNELSQEIQKEKTALEAVSSGRDRSLKKFLDDHPTTAELKAQVDNLRKYFCSYPPTVQVAVNNGSPSISINFGYHTQAKIDDSLWEGLEDQTLLCRQQQAAAEKRLKEMNQQLHNLRAEEENLPQIVKGLVAKTIVSGVKGADAGLDQLQNTLMNKVANNAGMKMPLGMALTYSESLTNLDNQL